MTDDELVALGLCDADRLHTSRPAFVRMLLEQGATVDEVRAAAVVETMFDKKPDDGA